jgi:hypothetical protein
LRCSVVGRHSNPDAYDTRTFRDPLLRLVHQAGPDALPPEVRQHVEIVYLRYSAGPERWAGQAPYDSHISGEGFPDKGNEDRTNPLLLF